MQLLEKCVNEESRFRTFWFRWAKLWWSSQDGLFGKFCRHLFTNIFDIFKILKGFHPSVFSSWSPQKFLRWSRLVKLSVSLENTSWPFFSGFSFTDLEPSQLSSSWLRVNCRTVTSLKCLKFWRQLSVLVQAQLQCRSPSIVSTTWELIHVSLALSFLLVQLSIWTVRIWNW